MRKLFLVPVMMMFAFFLGACSSNMSGEAITKSEVREAQMQWANGIVHIGKVYLEKGDYEAAALEHINTLYAYDNGGVLFKPTKAAVNQFRDTKASALDYFIGKKGTEDDGFAINPWSNVRFDGQERILLEGTTAVAMGNYYFTDAKTNNEVKVEYTFGYKKDENGNLRIFLHHSSLPYSAK